MKQLLNPYHALMKGVVGVACLIGTLLVSGLDYLSGFNVDMSVFYFIPIVLASIYLSRIFGFSLAILSAILFFLVNRIYYQDVEVFAYVNTGMHAVSFIVVGFLFSYLQEEEDEIDVLDQKLTRTLQKTGRRR
jgi:low affinity Fe/Cu permease